MFKSLIKILSDIIQSLEKVRDNVFKIRLIRSIPIWIASLVAGVVTVGYTKLFVLAESIMKDIFHLNHYYIFALAPVCMLAGWWLVKKFAPNATGSGIPQVMASISLVNRKSRMNIKSLLSLRIVLIKIFSSLLLVLGGAAIGREGPTIQISASIFDYFNKLLPRNWPKYKRSSVIVAGAAAGLAAAFNTPLGGIVFAIEELSRVHVRFYRSALIIAVIISGLTAQGLLGSYLYLGLTDVSGVSLYMFDYVIIVAVAAGILGSLMSKAILFIIHWKNRYMVKSYHHIIYIVLTAMAISVLANTVSPVILGTGKDSMQHLLFSKTPATGWFDFPMRYVGTLLSFTLGAAGGIFAPALSAGATLGGFVGQLFHLQQTNSHLIVLAGMVAFLTAITRTPFTSAILVLEMTDRSSVIFFLLLSGLVSSFVSRFIDKKSLYDHLKVDYLIKYKKEAQARRELKLLNQNGTNNPDTATE